MQKIKSNLGSNDGPIQNFPNQKSFKWLQSEDQLIKCLFDQTQQMRNLMAIASEIYLLSTQLKYKTQQIQQIGMIKI